MPEEPVDEDYLDGVVIDERLEQRMDEIKRRQKTRLLLPRKKLHT